MSGQNTVVIAPIWKHARVKTLDDYEGALFELEPYLAKPPARGTVTGKLFYALIKQIAA